MSEETKNSKKIESKDYTKNHGLSEAQLKKQSAVEYLDHSSLKKNNKGINPGDKAYVGQMAALQLEKEGKAKILSNKLEIKKPKVEKEA